MRLLQLDHQGTEAFRAPLSVDFSSLPEVIAICGPVGSGKTTFLDLGPAALFLTLPYRPGPLHEIFVESGFIRMTWSHRGVRYLSVITVDVLIGKTEALLYELPSVTTPIAGPLQRNYLSKIQSILGDLSSFLVVSYALQPTAASVRKPSSFLTIPRADRRAFLADMLGLNRYETWQTIADEQTRTLEQQLDRLMVQHDEQKKVADGLAGILGALEDAKLQAKAAQEAQEWAQMAADAVQQRIVSHAGTTELLAKIRESEGELRRRRDELHIRYTTIAGDLDGAEEILGQRQEILEASEAIAACQKELVMVAERLEAVQEARAERVLIESAVSQRQQQLNDVALVDQVPCGGAPLYAGCPFLQRAALDRHQFDALTQEVQGLTGLLTAMAGLESERTSLIEVRKGLEQRVELLKPVVSKRSALDAAVADHRQLVERRSQLIADVALLDAQLERLAAQRQALESKMEPGLISEADVASQRLAEAYRLVVSTQQELAVQEERRRQAEAALVAMGMLLQDWREQKAQHSMWSLIQKAVSPTGIPALKVDQALPVISAQATKMLRECMAHGQWEIQIISQKPSADQKRALETLEVVITRHGKIVPSQILSGGEGVLISEALASAIAQYRSEHDAGEAGTVLRDEISSSLGSLAGSYVEMLRNIVRVGGATQVLFATHDRDAMAKADARVMVGQGQVQIA